MLFLLIEIGAATVGVGIEAQLGMDEIIHERGDVDIAGVALHRVGKVIRLYHLLHGVHIVLYIGHLLGLQVFLLRIDARPDDLARHDAFANARHFRGEGGIILIEGVDAQQVSASQLASADVALFHLADVHAVLPPLDGFCQDVDASVLAVHGQLAHHRPRSPVPHVAPQLESQRVAQHRHVVIGSQQHPVAVSRQAQQAHVELMAVGIACLHGVFLLIEGQRAVATKLDANGTVEALCLHVSRHFLLRVQRRRGGDGYRGQAFLSIYALGESHCRQHGEHDFKSESKVGLPTDNR